MKTQVPDTSHFADKFPTTSRLLVVNADDYGMTESISMGILEAVKAGAVTSISCVTNTPSFEKAADRLKELDVDCGIHLNLNSGRPLSTQAEIPILNKDGSFVKNPLTRPLFFFISTPRYRSWLENEFRKQIEKLLSKKINPTHIDSHYHIHVFPALIHLVVKLAYEYHIPFIRIPFEKRFIKNAVSPRHGIISTLARRASRIINRPRLDFFGLTEAGKVDKSVLKKILKNISTGASELMIHPGYGSQENLHFYASEPRHIEKELDAITSPDIAETLRECGIRLTRYSELPK